VVVELSFLQVQVFALSVVANLRPVVEEAVVVVDLLIRPLLQLQK
jgi:hypothetical protein